jgi:drug/metabolite transporter (DMT)-like permease
MLKGIFLVLGACFIWGLIFVVPKLMAGFSSFEVALGRYFFYGVISFAFMLFRGWQKWKQFSWNIWRLAILYALIVNILYYFSLVMALRCSSPSVIALLLGLSPITIAFYGNWRQKECSYRQLIIPSLLIVSGLICVNWGAFSTLSPSGTWEYIFGLCCGCFSLIAWNWYVVSNARFLKEHSTSLSSSDWCTLIGVATFAWVLLIGLIILISSTPEYFVKYTLFDQPFFQFLLGGMILGLFCSWIGSYLWNIGSQALPISLAGQLTIFETIFGLIFVHLVEQHIPSLTELAGILTILAGVGLSMRAFSRGTSTQQLHTAS